MLPVGLASSASCCWQDNCGRIGVPSSGTAGAGMERSEGGAQGRDASIGGYGVTSGKTRRNGAGTGSCVDRVDVSNLSGGQSAGGAARRGKRKMAGVGSQRTCMAALGVGRLEAWCVLITSHKRRAQQHGAFPLPTTSPSHISAAPSVRLLTQCSGEALALGLSTPARTVIVLSDFLFSICYLSPLEVNTIPNLESSSTPPMSLAMPEKLATQDEGVSALLAFVFSGAIGSPEGKGVSYALAEATATSFSWVTALEDVDGPPVPIDRYFITFNRRARQILAPRPIELSTRRYSARSNRPTFGLISPVH